MTSHRWDPIPATYDPLKAGSIDGTDKAPHDHGIVRAMQAEYKPNKLVIGNPKATVFVGRLNPRTSETTIQEVFSHCGKIKRMRLIRDIVTGFSRGYAFIEYFDRLDAIQAQRDLHQTILEDNEILVDEECERRMKGWIPRRLGGGLSGKKESGQLRFGGKVKPFKRPIILNQQRSFNDRNRSRDTYHDDRYQDKHHNDRYQDKYHDARYTDKHHNDRYQDKHQDERYPDKHHDDRYPDKHHDDRYPDKHHDDRYPDKHHDDKYQDKYHDDKYQEKYHSSSRHYRH